MNIYINTMSVQYIQREVNDIRQDPQEDTWTELIVGVDENHAEEAKHRLQQESATIKTELPFSLFHIRTRETTVNAICNIDTVQSVELNDSLEMLSSGNPCSPRGPTT